MRGFIENTFREHQPMFREEKRELGKAHTSARLVRNYLKSNSFLAQNPSLYEAISNWYEEVGRHRKITDTRIRELLRNLYIQADGNAGLMQDAIETAVAKNWLSFWVNKKTIEPEVKQTSEPVTPIQMEVKPW